MSINFKNSCNPQVELTVIVPLDIYGFPAPQLCSPIQSPPLLTEETVFAKQLYSAHFKNAFIHTNIHTYIQKHTYSYLDTGKHTDIYTQAQTQSH